MKSVTLITGNRHKVKEFERMLGLELKAKKIDLPEIQDTDVSVVAKAKAQMAYDQLQRPVVVDDSGIYLHAWGKLPGALVFWFVDIVGVKGILKMLDGWDNRGATAEVAVAYCDKNGPRVFTGTLDGTVAPEPRGLEGFGYDVIFIPTGHTKTRGEMTPEERDPGSPRRAAIEQLREFLMTSEK